MGQFETYKMTHYSTRKISTSTSQTPFLAFMLQHWLTPKRVWKHMFSAITFPTLTNLCLESSTFWCWWALWVSYGKPLASYWCVSLKAIQVSLCAIRDIQIDKLGNCEKYLSVELMNRHKQWGSQMWLEITFRHQSLRNFTHEYN